MSKELKPCPFCGGEAKYNHQGLVFCANNHCCGSTIFANKNDWNTRPTPDIEKVMEEFRDKFGKEPANTCDEPLGELLLGKQIEDFIRTHLSQAVVCQENNRSEEE